MGQKINPISFRLGITGTWSSRWWPKKGFKDQLEEDMTIRRIVREKVSLAGIVRIDIERTSGNGFRVIIKVAKPGLVIGRGGKGIEELSRAVEGALKALLRKRGVVQP